MRINFKAAKGFTLIELLVVQDIARMLPQEIRPRGVLAPSNNANVSPAPAGSIRPEPAARG
jgi:hypothetical protein